MKIHLNSDSELVKQIQKAIDENDGYCPCKVKRTEDTKCMCKEFLDSKEPGPCHCGLYIKELVS